MSVEEIIKEIEGGLTGEVKKDMDKLGFNEDLQKLKEKVEKRKALLG